MEATVHVHLFRSYTLEKTQFIRTTMISTLFKCILLSNAYVLTENLASILQSSIFSLIFFLNDTCRTPFGLSNRYSTRAGPRYITAADFNHDNNIDIAVTSTDGNSVNVLLGNGNGAFQRQVSYRAGARPKSIATADLVVANADGKSISTFLGY